MKAYLEAFTEKLIKKFQFLVGFLMKSFNKKSMLKFTDFNLF